MAAQAEFASWRTLEPHGSCLDKSLALCHARIHYSLPAQWAGGMGPSVSDLFGKNSVNGWDTGESKKLEIIVHPSIGY